MNCFWEWKCKCTYRYTKSKSEKCYAKMGWFVVSTIIFFCKRLLVFEIWIYINDGTTVLVSYCIIKQVIHLGLNVRKGLWNISDYRTSSGVWFRFAVWKCHMCCSYNMLARPLHNTASESFCFICFRFFCLLHYVKRPGQHVNI